MANEFRREVQLPSRGLPYGGALGDGHVVVGPWNTDIEKLIAGGAGVRDLLDRVIKQHVRPAGQERWPMPVTKLITVDRIFLLFQVRMATFPSRPYGFRVPCGNCGRGVDMTVDLATRPTHFLGLDEEGEYDWKEALVCELDQGTELQLRFLTGEDEAAVIKMAERRVRASRRRKKDSDDEAYVLELAKHIETIDGEEVNMGAALELVEGLHGGDLLTIKETLADIDFGLDGEVVAECTRCGFDTHTAMSFSDEFFRPRRAQRSRSARRGKRTRVARTRADVPRRHGDGNAGAPLVASGPAREDEAGALGVRPDAGPTAEAPVSRRPTFEPGGS